MRIPKLCILGAVGYLCLSSVIFTIDVLVGQGGSGKVYELCWLPILILTTTVISIGTTRYLINKFDKSNKLFISLLIIMGVSLQIIMLYFLFILLALTTLAPILGRAGFYVTMP